MAQTATPHLPHAAPSSSSQNVLGTLNLAQRQGLADLLRELANIIDKTDTPDNRH